MSAKVCSSVKRIRQANKEYIKMRRVCGVDHERTEREKEYYFKRK